MITLIRKLTLPLLVCIPLLAGCGTIKQFVASPPQVIERTPLVLPEIPPVEQYPFDWYVITSDNVQDKFKETGSVIIGVTPEGFKNLNLSIAELRKFIQEQKAIIEAQKQYYDHPIKEEKVNGK